MNEKNIVGQVVSIKANYLLVKLQQEYLQASKEILEKQINLSSFRLLCTCRNKIIYNGEKINVGDNVFLDSIDWKNSRAVISKLIPRRNRLTRPSIANVDKVFVVASLRNPTLDLDQISRFLISAEQKDLTASIILSKNDLLSSEDSNFQLDRFRSWGYEAFAVSVKTNYGFRELENSLLKTKLSVFCGPSGVGKTSLINRFLPHVTLPIGSLSRRLQRGKNTTRHVELFSIKEDCMIADTPGFNRPDLLIDPIHFADLFPEIRSQLQLKTCKFRDCLHRDEPGCVIDKNFDRYRFYRENLEEMMINYRR